MKSTKSGPTAKTHNSYALNPHKLHKLITVAVQGYPKKPIILA